MGKKTRPSATAGRRTIIQLSPPSLGLRSGATGGGREEAGSGSDDDQDGSCDGQKFLREETTNMRNPTVKATEGLSLLGAYDDSDDEDADSSPAVARSQHNPSADIDSTLANFMAEIDAITTQPASEEPPPEDPQAPPPTPPRPEPKTPQPDTDKAAEQPSAAPEFQYDTQCSLAGVGVEMGDWQEVWDENTGCYYYWNTLTNEVAWELPHYLAHQVQGLQQYSSATVNGNGTSQTAGFYPEQNSVTTTTTSTVTVAPKREPKKKEVMESVVALTSEEEERHGVAASLLAPLIPTEVKEAEEKWRKRLLGLDKEENSLDGSDGGEGTPRLLGSPAPPLGDPDTPSRREQRSRNQSKDNSDAEEEEPEEDTMELELALERKKAELRALEEGDVSAGGSSPASDGGSSQEAPGPRSLLLKKARWKTAFVQAASPDSNSRSSETERQDNADTTAHSRGPEKAGGEEEEEKEERAEEKPAAKAPPKEEVETPELKFQIGELANTLTSKMEFLGINRKAISNFQLLLLQTEMRIADWREGALNGMYLRRKLQEAAEHIKHYELNAAPKGWSCHWDREHRRYFYVNDRTSASQWDFPDDKDEEEEKEVEKEEEGEEGQKGSQTPQTGPAGQGEPKPPAVAPSEGIGGSSSHTPPLAPLQPPFWSAPQPPLPPETPAPPADHPPPPPPPPESPPPPPPPPDSDDGEIMEVEMEDEEGEPPAPGTEEDGGLRIPFVPKPVEPPVSLGKALKRKAPGAGAQLSKAVTMCSSAILYTQTAIAAAPVMSGSAYWGVPVVAAPSLLPPEVPAVPLPPPPTQPPAPPVLPPSEPPGAKVPPTDKTKKIKKEKSKKSKTALPPLVKKWQSIQKELDEEEKESSSEEEDRDLLNKRGIEEWKQQQLLTGKAGKNANFEALPDDWRQRLLKKRKMMKS